MNNQEYLATQRHVLLVADLVEDMPLKEFIELADKADAIGPILDPTLWRDGHESLDIIRRLARGLRTFQDEVVKLLEEANHVKV